MTNFTVKLLGVLAAQPTATAITSGQIVTYKSQSWVIDCGEGFQMKMQKYKTSRNKIKGILISHLHGDHVYGLPGFLTSLAIANRIEPLLIVGPEGIIPFVLTMIEYSHAHLPYELKFHESTCKAPEQIYNDPDISIEAVPLYHRVPTIGYIIREKERRANLLPDQIEKYQLSVQNIKALLGGETISLSNGQSLRLADVSAPAKPPRSYAYCSDTMYSEDLIRDIGQVTTIYHESTYVEADAASAPKWGHSTAKQAAMVAKAVHAEQLILGHYSGKYADYTTILDEANSIFSDSILGVEGLEVKI